MSPQLKSLGKKLLRRVGVEAHSYIPGSSREAQLQAALKHFRIGFVIDVGANEGQFGLELIDSGFGGQILSVEPLPMAHRQLMQRAQQHPQWRIAAPCALGAEAGTVEFHVAANSVSSSVLPVTGSSVDAAPGSRHVEKLSVAQSTVDILVQQHELPRHGGLLKIDTQGYEWAVLDGAEASLDRFDLVMLELSLTELYVGQHLWLDVIHRMERLGFATWLLQPEFVDPTSGRTLQVNGLFARHRPN
ncbi:FkbM family methyltransferase [Piscinibacter sakaiensis]|uniref:FkbM family methyltransferase n=1 Tax=Piscinibacter sakaiensis TaxID=1547922 RepID=UPI003AAA6090